MKIYHTGPPQVGRSKGPMVLGPGRSCK